MKINKNIWESLNKPAGGTSFEHTEVKAYGGKKWWKYSYIRERSAIVYIDRDEFYSLPLAIGTPKQPCVDPRMSIVI